MIGARSGVGEIEPQLARALINDPPQQLGRQVGKPISAGSGAPVALDQLLANKLYRMRSSINARAAAAQSLRRRDRAPDHVRPQFQGTVGTISSARGFDAVLRNNGYTEPRFAAEQKRLTLRRELAETVSGALLTPKTLEQAYNRFAMNSARSTMWCSTAPRPATSRRRRPTRSQGISKKTKACSARPSTAASSSCRSRPATLRAPRT